MDFRTKLSEWIYRLIPVFYGFIAGVAVGTIFLPELNYNTPLIFNLSIKHLLYLLILTFFLISFLFTSLQQKLRVVLQICCLWVSMFILGILCYLRTIDYSSEYHLTAKVSVDSYTDEPISVTEKYKFLDVDFTEQTIVYGTIVTDPDIRENATYIVVKPEIIIPEPTKVTIEIDTATAKTIVVEDFVTRITDTGKIRIKSGQYINFLGVKLNPGESYKQKIYQLLTDKLLNKKVTLIFQEDYLFTSEDDLLAIVISNNEIINKTLIDKGLATVHLSPQVQIVRKVLSGEKIELKGNTGLIRAKVLPTIGDYYFQMSYGDYVKIASPLMLPRMATNPAGFNFRKYLKSRGIYATTKTLRYPNELEYLGEGKVSILTNFAFLLRRRMLLTIRKTVPYPSSAFLGGVTLGYRGGVPVRIRQEFQATGVAHVLALSGLHTGFIAVLILILCNIFRLKSILRFIVVSFGLLVFTIMTGATPATQRAAIMFCLGLFLYDVLKLSLLHATRFTLVFTAVIILLINPLWLPDASFVLSFMAVWSLVYVSPVIEKLLLRKESKLIHQYITFPLFTIILGMTLISLFGGILKEVSLIRKFFPILTKVGMLETYFPKWFNVPTSQWLNKGEFVLVSLVLYFCGIIGYQLYSWTGKSLIKDMLSNRTMRGLLSFVSAQVAIQIGMMWPLSSVYFYRFPISGFYANFLAIPLIGLIVQLGWIAALTDIFFSSLGSLIGLGKLGGIIGENIALVINAFNNQLCETFLGMAKTWGNFVPYPYVEMFSAGSLILWYFSAGLLIYYDKIIPFVKNVWKQKNFTPIIFSVLVGILIFSVSILSLPYWKKEKSIEIIFFDVNFGNSVLIKTPKKDLLIDTGPPGPPQWSPAESAIAPTLTKYKIKSLDKVILTSLKPQCIGGAQYILSHFPTKCVYLPSNYIDISTMSYYDFLENRGLWNYLINPYDYEPAGLYLTLYRLSKMFKNYKGEIQVVSKSQKVIEEKINGTKFEVFLFTERTYDVTTDVIGNTSYIVKIVFGKNSVLLLPQTGKELQDILIKKYSEKLNAKIVLIPQNGNYKVFNEKLISRVKPEIAICQYGWTNQRIGYFDVSVILPTIKKYETVGVKVYRTDHTGAVICKLFPERYELDTVVSEEEYKIKSLSDSE